MSLSFAALNVLNFLVAQIENDQVVPAEICPQDELSEIHHELMAQNLLMKDDRLAGNPTFYILPAARASARRLSKRYRQAAIQLEIMSKIEGNPDRGSTDDYYPPANVRGVPVTESEYQRALSHLTDWEFIKGTKHWGEGLIRPELTPNGYSAHESGYSPEDWISMNKGHTSTISNIGDTNTMNINGPVGAAQQGDHNTATVTQNVGLDAEGFATALLKIRELIDRADLADDDRDAAHAQLEMIDEQAKNGATQGRVRGFFRILGNALPAALATELADLIGQAVSALPA
ncbi:hypothetical protein ACIGB6_14420 [Paeniglutamicibacter gangotriensis]|uniref:hypothetical protein n=1 Tax=Paeniglutamicibacter gangotriensis TaxID=254787 RepID=UPI0037C6B6D1